MLPVEGHYFGGFPGKPEKSVKSCATYFREIFTEIYSNIFPKFFCIFLKKTYAHHLNHLIHLLFISEFLLIIYVHSSTFGGKLHFPKMFFL